MPKGQHGRHATLRKRAGRKTSDLPKKPEWNVNPKGKGTDKAVLLDLDGPFFDLVCHYGETGVAARDMSEVSIVKGLEVLLEELKVLGYHIIGVTNQPDMARRKFSHEGFLDEKFSLLKAEYPQFEEILICPHTETDLCSCRKPKSGLLKMAAAQFNLELSQCWMVGDSRGDIEAGMLVHAKTIFLLTDWNVGNPAIDKATAFATSTLGALQLIVDVSKKRSNVTDT